MRNLRKLLLFFYTDAKECPKVSICLNGNTVDIPQDQEQLNIHYLYYEHFLEALANGIGQKKEVKSIRIDKEDVNLWLLGDVIF